MVPQKKQSEHGSSLGKFSEWSLDEFGFESTIDLEKAFCITNDSEGNLVNLDPRKPRIPTEICFEGVDENGRSLEIILTPKYPNLPNESYKLRRNRVLTIKQTKRDANVARTVEMKERNNTPAALESVKKEWNKLRSVTVWDESAWRDKRDIIKESHETGTTHHFAELFDICVEKGSELPLGDKNRKFKGRVVFRGNRVRDTSNEVAMFQELGSNPATMTASRMADVKGLVEGYVIQIADAENAYVQCDLRELQGLIPDYKPCWVSLPKHEWTKEWIEKLKEDPDFQPVCPLLRALYGHPDAGGIWERYCEKALKKLGFTEINNWPSCYRHEEEDLIMIVYVDDLVPVLS